jgi:hypothetical protein
MWQCRLAGASSLNAVTFVENHDTDLNAFLFTPSAPYTSEQSLENQA